MTETETETHEHGREESGRFTRVTCSCGWLGAWHFTAGPTAERLLGSDDNAHLFAVRRHSA